MTENIQTASGVGWRTWLSERVAELRQSEDQIVLVLALVIGALTGLAVVAFILLTERMGMRLYPVGGAPWRRLLRARPYKCHSWGPKEADAIIGSDGCWDNPRTEKTSASVCGATTKRTP
jgi:hypothetical protein